MTDFTGLSQVFDEIDRIILDDLRQNARITFTDLGQRVGLSATATADRVRRLESMGVLRGYHAEIDLSALGIGLRAVTEIRLTREGDPDAFEATLARTPQVQGAMHVTGSLDYVLFLACEDVPTLDRILSKWREEDGVEESSTRIVLREIDLWAEN